MAQRRKHRGPDVLETDVVTLVEHRADLAGQNQSLKHRLMRRGTEPDETIRHIRREFTLRVGRQNQANGVILNVLGNDYVTNQILSFDNTFGPDNSIPPAEPPPL